MGEYGASWGDTAEYEDSVSMAVHSFWVLELQTGLFLYVLV